MSQGTTVTDRNPASVLFLGLAGAIFFCALYLLIRYFYPLDGQPKFFADAYDVPLALAPIVTALVSNLALSRVIVLQDDKVAKIASLAALIWTSALCLFLSFVHLWFWHLTLLLLLFVGFCAWDFTICGYSQADDNLKKEVLRGHKYINIPTIISVVVILLCLTDVWLSGSWDVFELKKGPRGFELTSFKSAIDAFTTGVVAFHLGVAAVSYVMVSTKLYQSLLIKVAPSLASRFAAIE